MNGAILNIIAIAIVEGVNVVGDMNEDELIAFGRKLGKAYNDNVSEKIPAGQRIEDVVEENIKRIEQGFWEGVNADEV